MSKSVEMADLQRWCSLAETAARSAGERLAEDRAQWAMVDSSKGHDIKLAADRHAEDIIVKALQNGSPFEILSEEAGHIAGESSELLWVVDPLDGSMNYLRGIPACCVSIALVRGGQPLAGIIYDFNRDEMFSGARGLGARCNSAVLSVSDTLRRSDAILGFGFPSSSDHSTKNLTRLINDIQSYKKVRALGSAAMMLAYVACGRLDAYFEEDIHFWDISAGAALVEAAGGRVNIVRRKGPGERVVVSASNGRLEEDA